MIKLGCTVSDERYLLNKAPDGMYMLKTGEIIVKHNNNDSGCCQCINARTGVEFCGDCNVFECRPVVIDEYCL